MDYPYLLKAFININDNALKYSPEASPIEIVASYSGNKVRVIIRDYGCGIPKEALVRIFDKFYRVESAENVVGTGLGLSISRNIIEAHGGHVRAESVLDKGAAFIIELPMV